MPENHLSKILIGVSILLIVVVSIEAVVIIWLYNKNKLAVTGLTQNLIKTQKEVTKLKKENEDLKKAIRLPPPSPQTAADIRREIDLSTILSSIIMYSVDNKGELPVGITENDQEISSTGADICTLLLPTYLNLLPIDPQINTGNSSVGDCSQNYYTGYHVKQNSETKKVTVSAPLADSPQGISITR